MKKRPLARVLIVDNDARVGRDLQRILKPRGFCIEIAQGLEKDLVKQASSTARKFRPHVAIVDLRLRDDYIDERSGFELLACLRSACCVLYSAYLSQDVLREAVNRHGATVWVGKGDSPEALLDAIANAAQNSCAGARGLPMHWPSTWESPKIIQTIFGQKTSVPPGSVADILGQLFPTTRELTLDTVGGKSIHAPPVSRGRSIVLTARADDLEPVIVKLAPAENVQGEYENYEKHVKGRLVGGFHAQLENTREFWELGGTIYSFIGSSLRSLPSFTEFYRGEEDPPSILKPLRHLFTEVWSGHYRRAQPGSERPLFEVYDEALHLRNRLQNLGDLENGLTFAGLSPTFPNPVQWVLDRAADSHVDGARLAITHGDLHGDNLFVDGQHAWVIDFERTGPGHILRDFVELEVDIVTRLVPLPQGDLSRFFQLILLLTETSDPLAQFPERERWPEESEIRKALGLIAGLRKLAHDVTLFSDFREYLWGLLLDALFVASLAPEQSPQRERALLLSSILCTRLEKWGQDWPPQSWSSVL
jgi:ActR/RegA family two-component response regulator